MIFLKMSFCCPSLGTCLQITCPAWYTECGGACYSIWCHEDSSTYALPRTPQQLDCLLEMADYSDLPIDTDYVNKNGAFRSLHDSSVVAPAELLGKPGPGGNSERKLCVVIDRKKRKLVRTSCEEDHLRICEVPPQ